MISEKVLMDQVALSAKEKFSEEYKKRSFETSGKTFLSIENKDNKIVANISMLTLIYGRKPGTYAPWGIGKDGKPTELMQWVKAKIVSDDKEAKSVSFLISRKLKERGNRIFEGKEKPMDTEQTIIKTNETMFDLVYQEYLKDFKIK